MVENFYEKLSKQTYLDSQPMRKNAYGTNKYTNTITFKTWHNITVVFITSKLPVGLILFHGCTSHCLRS